MKKTNILLITHTYPYILKRGGETFVHAEIQSWAQNKSINLTILPKEMDGGDAIELPANVKVDDFLSTLRSKPRVWLVDILNTLFNADFINRLTKEVATQKLLFQPTKSLFTIKSFLLMAIYYQAFVRYFRHRSFDCVYTYWFDDLSNALCLLKQQHGFTLITRAHGIDFQLEEHKKRFYFAFRAQVINNFDGIFLVSDGSKQKIQRQYPDANNMKLSRLGVDDDGFYCQPTPENHLTLVSCSGLIARKQAHKIIESIHCLAMKNPSLTIKWYHLGDGPLRKSLSRLCQQLLSTLPNVDYTFVGLLANAEVKAFYHNNKIDVFVHFSHTEGGCPVSIQEALSYGIPIVGFNINGVVETIVDGKNGFLLDKQSSCEDIALTLSQGQFFKDPEVRKNAHAHFKVYFDAEQNFHQFQQQILALIDNKTVQAQRG